MDAKAGLMKSVQLSEILVNPAEQDLYLPFLNILTNVRLSQLWRPDIFTVLLFKRTDGRASL